MKIKMKNFQKLKKISIIPNCIPTLPAPIQDPD